MQYKYLLLSMEWFYAHCKAVTYVCAYSALAMSPGSVKSHVWETAGHGTYGYFSLHSSFLHVLTGSREAVKKTYCFSSSYWNSTGGSRPATCVISFILLWYKVTLHLSHSCPKADTHSPSGMLEPRGACYDLALLSCWPWRERIASVGKQAVHECVCMCVCHIRMSAGDGSKRGVYYLWVKGSIKGQTSPAPQSHMIHLPF